MSPSTQNEDLTKRLNDLERQIQLIKKAFGQNQVTNHHDLLGSGQTSHADLDFHVENRDNRRKHLSSTFIEVYPVGCIYVSVDSTNPSILFGGTWVVFGAGKVLVGLDSSDTDFDTAEETRGEKTHVLGEAEMPAHVHALAVVKTQQHEDNYNYGVAGSSVNTGVGSALVTTNAGANTAHNNIQPSIVVYMWKRTA